jgi:glycosyltransferase involved in cell wall biosynthesis
VFALPSIAETFGIVILEAMQAGVPVVASKVGGILDIITNKKNGLLTQPKNSKELAGSIIEILGNSALSSKLSREGKIRVKDFDWAKIIKQINRAYLELFEN